MRANVFNLLICLCALSGAQAELRADPDPSFKLNTEFANPETWVRVLGEYSVVVGKGVVLKAPQGSVALVRSNPEKVKNTEWYSFGVSVESKDARTPHAGLVFAFKDAKNYCAIVLREKSVVALEFKAGIESVICSFPLKAEPGQTCSLSAEIQMEFIGSIYVNGEMLYTLYESESKEAAEALKKWKFSAKDGLGLLCESGECTFKSGGASGIAKK